MNIKQDYSITKLLISISIEIVILYSFIELNPDYYIIGIPYLVFPLLFFWIFGKKVSLGEGKSFLNNFLTHSLKISGYTFCFSLLACFQIGLAGLLIDKRWDLFPINLFSFIMFIGIMIYAIPFSFLHGFYIAYKNEKDKI